MKPDYDDNDYYYDDNDDKDGYDDKTTVAWGTAREMKLFHKK